MSAPRFRRIVLTGASGGIGRALAAELAAPGVAFLLTGRNADRLEAAAEAVRARGGTAETARVDVTEREALTEAILRFDAEGPVDLLIANAGVTIGLGPSRSPEDPDAARRLWEVNYQGAVNACDAVIPTMRARRAGAIALMGSLAGLRPQPDLPSYSASKAALHAYGEALRGWLRPDGVRVTVIRPGFVTSPMSARHEGFKPFEISAERAARIVARGLARGRAYVSFPWPLVAAGWIDARLMPARLSDFLNRAFGARVLPEGEEDQR